MGVFAPPTHSPFVSSAWARYISTQRIRDLISLEYALPSQIVKEHLQLSAMNSAAQKLIAERCRAIDRNC